MPDFRRTTCRVTRGGCGRSSEEVGPISWRGLCGDCGPRIASQANDDMHFHTGPVFNKWRQAMAASVGAVLIDETDEGK